MSWTFSLSNHYLKSESHRQKEDQYAIKGRIERILLNSPGFRPALVKKEKEKRRKIKGYVVVLF